MNTSAYTEGFNSAINANVATPYGNNPKAREEWRAGRAAGTAHFFKDYEIVNRCDGFYQVEKENRPVSGKIAFQDSAVNFIIKRGNAE